MRSLKCKTVIRVYRTYTVKSVLKDHSSQQVNVVSQDRWSLVTGSLICLEQQVFVPENRGLSERRGLKAVVSQNRLHWIYNFYVYMYRYISNFNIFPCCKHDKLKVQEKFKL